MKMMMLLFSVFRIMSIDILNLIPHTLNIMTCTGKDLKAAGGSRGQPNRHQCIGHLCRV